MPNSATVWELDENNDVAMYYKGMILKRMGRFNGAMRCFKDAVLTNKSNIDAKRELHLAKKMGLIA